MELQEESESDHERRKQRSRRLAPQTQRLAAHTQNFGASLGIMRMRVPGYVRALRKDEGMPDHS